MQGGTVQVAVFPVDEQGGSGGGEKEEQVDALGGPLVHVKKQCHHQQQQRSAAHAPGGENTGAQTAEKGNEPVRHSRYFTPA